MMISNSNNKRKQTLPKSKPSKTCDKCSFTSNEIVEFIEHMKIDHNLDEIYPCDLCVFYTESLWDYQGHMEKHLEQKHSKAHNVSSLSNSTNNETLNSSATESTTGSESLVNNKVELDTNKPVMVDNDKCAVSSDKEEESEGSEDESGHSEEDGSIDMAVMGGNKSSLLTTITNANNDFYDKTNQKHDNNQSLKSNNNEADRHFSPSKMIYSPNTHSSGAFNYSMLAQHNSRGLSNHNSTNYHSDSQGIEKVKRHYNSEVDPARYRKVMEEGVTKFACSLCGNTYKWRKSLNKHWKEKHITEAPPPLDAPVTVKLRNGNTTINCIAGAGGQQTLPVCNQSGSQSPVQKSNSENYNQNSAKLNWSNKQANDEKVKSSPLNLKSTATPNIQSQLPFPPSLLIAAAAAAHTATSGQNQQMGATGQMHPNYWTVFHQYLNSATNTNNNNTQSSTTTSSSNNNKFSINHLTSSSNHNSEIPLDLSMKQQQQQQPITTHTNSSRRSSLNSSCSGRSSESATIEQQINEELRQHKKQRHSRRSDFNMQQLLAQKPKSSRSSSRCSSSSSSVNSSMSIKEDLTQAKIQSNESSIKQEAYQSYTEDDSNLNITHNSTSKHSQSSAAAAAAATAYNQKLFVCSICDAKFHVVDHINEHFLKNHYTEYQRELSSKSPPRNTNVAQQNEEWNLSDPNNPLKCVKCDFVGRWPTELQKHAASHSTSRPFKCLICSLTYKWRWDLAKHFDRTHPNFRNPYKKRDRDAARSNLVTPNSSANNGNSSNLSLDQEDQYADDVSPGRSRSRSSSSNSENIARIQQLQQQNEVPEVRGIKKEGSLVVNRSGQKMQTNGNGFQGVSKQVEIPMSKSNGQIPNGMGQMGAGSKCFDNLSQDPTQQQFANNPMLAYLAALQQSNMFQQQQQSNALNLTNNSNNNNNAPTSSSSSNQHSNQQQTSPYSLLQQQHQNNKFMPQQQPPQFDSQSILAAAMAAIAQQGVDPTNMTHLLPHLLQNIQQQQTQSSSSSTSSNNSTKNQQNNYNSNLLSPSSSSSSHSYKQVSHHKSQSQSQKTEQPIIKKQKLNDSIPSKSDLQMDDPTGGEKEARNFLCYWCDFRGRWRSEIIQHMRCHHAREKPYRCSACMYASNWKWDVQKHTKKQHPNNQNAKIVEISDQILFPDLKDLNFFENVKPTLPNSSPNSQDNNLKKIPSLNLTPPNSSSASSTSSSSSHSSLNLNNNNSKPIKNPNMQETRGRPRSKNSCIESSPSIRQNESPAQKPTTKMHSLCCQQCPYVACNLSDLRRHLIVHSNEQPYHCCSCDFKSKWKSDVKKHQRNLNHIGPILVGKKAMQKVIENLGLDKNSMVTLYGPNIQVIDNKQCKSNEKLIDEDNCTFSNNNKDAINYTTKTFHKSKNGNKFIASRVVNKSDLMLDSSPVNSSGSLKRKNVESDVDEEFEEQQYDEEDDYDDEYEQVLAYNNNNYNEGDDADDVIDMEMDGEENDVDDIDDDGPLIEPLMVSNGEEYDEIHSQFTEDGNNLCEQNLNEFEEEIDC